VKTLTIVLLAAALALGVAGPAAAEVIPVQRAAPAPAAQTPMQAVGPILAGIVGIGAGALIATTVAPLGATYPAAIIGGAMGAMAGWNIYKNVSGPPLVKASGPKMAEAPSLLQLAVDIRTAD
jgi:hypothetical protein